MTQRPRVAYGRSVARIGVKVRVTLRPMARTAPRVRQRRGDRGAAIAAREALDAIAAHCAD